MRKHSKLILASLTASLLMSLAVSGTASARVFSATHMTFRATWRSLEFTNTTGFGTVRCPVTLEGVYHSQTISKVEKALIGRVTLATLGEPLCTGGTATIHQESLAWQVTYNGFRGLLPRINNLRFLTYGIRFQIRQPLLARTCTATADIEHEAKVEAILNGAEEITNFVPDEGPDIPTNGTCEVASIRLRASATDGTVTAENTTTRIRVRLI